MSRRVEERIDRAIEILPIPLIVVAALLVGVAGWQVMAFGNTGAAMVLGVFGIACAVTALLVMAVMGRESR